MLMKIILISLENNVEQNTWCEMKCINYSMYKCSYQVNVVHCISASNEKMHQRPNV